MSIVEESFRLYWGNSDDWLLYILSLACLLYWKKKCGKQRILLWYAGLILLVILNPIFPRVIHSMADSSTTYVRVYYLLPVFVTIAYIGVQIITTQEESRKKGILLAVLCLVIVLSGKSYYELNAYQKTENIYKIPEEQRYIADVLLADVGEGEKANTLVTYWDPNWYFIRQYTSRVVGIGSAMPDYGYKNEKFTCYGDIVAYIEYIKSTGLDFSYLIEPNLSGLAEDCRQGGHTILAETENYVVIKVKE